MSTILSAELEDSPLLGLQVWEAMRGALRTYGPISGEQRLNLAQLELAIEDISGKRRRRERHGAAAMVWVMAGYDSTLNPDARSFEGCCLSLGIDPVALRAAIVALRPAERRARQLSHSIDRDEDRRVRRRRRPRIIPVEVAA